MGAVIERVKANCGMAREQQEWCKTLSLKVQFKPSLVDHAKRVQMVKTRVQSCILPEIKKIAPADVMRGE